MIQILERFRGASLIGATLTMGLTAGLFFAYSCSVMPGLAKADDRTFVETMQRINVAVLLITSGVSVPLNNKLAAAGKLDHIPDLATVRHDFEGSWVAWNVARAVANSAAFGCLIWALVVYGRLTRRA